ncbi:hypothetical protein [Luteimonas sp. e5]
MRLSMLALPLIAALSLPALAQQDEARMPIEQQMSAEEFKAAGLDKLSPAELARLNAWLGRTVAAESQKAVAEARREETTRSARGGSLFGGGGTAFEARLQGRFEGFGRGKRYTLDNGQVWEQIDDTTMYGVRLDNPSVQLKPSLIGSAWYMRVDGRAVNAKVKRIK